MTSMEVGNPELSCTSSYRATRVHSASLSLPPKVAFKEFLRPALALFAEHYRLRPGFRIGDVPLGMEAFHRIPIVRLPRSPRPRRR
jgi:hypothetical protein